jgi:hypothetical protein
MPIKAYFDGPTNYTGKFNFYEQGGSPHLLDILISIIEENKNELIEINFCWYLFNNNILHNYLKSISDEGVKVNVITIPLEGYDNQNPKQLKDLKTGNINSAVTKYSLAKTIFKEMYLSQNYANYNIYFFPHIFVRSERIRKFSRGKLPYSLHIKSAYFKKKNGSNIILSSSNLAVRDLVKHESLINIEDEVIYEESMKKFFSDLIKNSINIKSYSAGYNTTCNTYNFIKPKKAKNTFITAPFYFDSSNELEISILDHIYKAKKRIIICAQHLAAYNYYFNSRFHSSINTHENKRGMLGAVIDMARKGIKTTCLSQTFSDPNNVASNYKGINFRKPVNISNFQQFYNELSNSKNADYYVNESLHSKFIIIDNKLIYCTYNFTPTQFIFLDKVNIPSFQEMPDISYYGTHCEVSAHIIIENPSIVNSFINHVSTIIKLSETTKVL